MKSWLYIAAASCALAMPESGQAALRDALIDGAKLCTQEISQQERLNGLPSHTLAAIANTESGRWNKTLGMVLPWPWTINAEGKGYYFDSKAQAIAKVRSLQAQGMKSIDVGCMQVNLKHHPNAFANLDQAFEPRTNVAYAAKFLRSNYDDIGHWSGAIAAYHSRTPKYGDKYRARVQQALDAITGKVRTARTVLASAARRDDSPSYRIIEVEGSAPRDRKSVRTIRPQSSSGMQLAMRESGGDQSAQAAPLQRAASPAKGFAIRPQDRLTSTPNVSLVRPSYKRISVSGGTPKQSTTLVKPMIASDPSAAAATPLDPPKSASKSAQPKFIFVE